MKKIYYFHGDEQDLKPNTYYCAFCDAFENIEHFRNHSGRDDHYKRYLRSQLALKKTIENYPKTKYYHPKEIKNIVSLFLYRSEIPTQKKGRFNKWVLSQIHRNDPIGDLAYDMKSDSTYPLSIDSIKAIRSYLKNKNACDEALQALEEAWQEYKSDKFYRSGISARKRFDIFKRDSYKCQICGATSKDNIRLEVDHKIPKSKGGSDNMNNLWTLCFKCNRGKRDKNL